MSTNERQPQKQVTDELILDLISLNIASLDAVDSQIQNLPQSRSRLHDSVEGLIPRWRQLIDIVPYHPKYLNLEGHLSRLNHDLSLPLLALRESARLDSPPPRETRAITTAVRHLIKSIPQEFQPTFAPVNLEEVVNKTIDFFSAFDKVMCLSLGIQVPKTKIRYTPLPRSADLTVFANEDVLFRIIHNLVRNSQKAIFQKFDTPGKGGEIIFRTRKDDKFTFLDILDNGVGFKYFFEQIGLKPTEEEVSLSQLIEAGKSISRFKQSGMGGSGLGLPICQHLAKLIGAEIYIKNPSSQEGGCISIKLPLPCSPTPFQN